MDFKGINWAGNIYQKFEAMCLEVEEVMYEDTAKYVENQVQKVGVSVKKFYEEIVQDLIPSSCVGPVEVSPGDTPLKPYTQTDINKNPKSSIIDVHAEIDKKETKDEDISDPTTEESSSNAFNDANLLFPVSPRVSVESTRSDVCSTKSKKVGVYKRPIGIKRIPKNNHPPKISRPLTSLSGDGSSLLSCNAKSNCLEVSDDVNIARSLKFFVRNVRGEAATENTPICDASAEPFSSNQNLLAVSIKQEKKDSQSTSSASEEILSDEFLMERKGDSEHNSSCHGLPTESIGTDRDEFMKNGSPSQMKSIVGSSTCKVEPLGEEVIASSEDKFDIELIETEDVLKPRLEMFEPVEKSSLEESCILVELDKLHFVSQATKKHKSYKKKIREALSSKLRSTRIHDQHNFHYQDSGEKKRTGAVIPERNLPCHDSCDSDWELL